MSTLQDLQSKIAQLASDIAAEKVEVQTMLTDLRTQVQTLSEQIAAGTPVTQEQLDTLVSSFDALDAAVKDISEPPAPVA